MDILDSSTPVRKRKRIPLSFILILIGIAVIAIGISLYANTTPSPVTPGADNTSQDQNRVTIYSTLDPNSNNPNIPISSNTKQNSQYQFSSSYQSPQPNNQQSPTPSSYISITYPTANQTLINDPSYHTPLAIIQWTSKNTPGTFISIDLQDQSGTIIKTITPNTPNNGNYAWFSNTTIPNGEYRIHIRALTANGVTAENTGDSFVIASPDASQHPTGGVWQTYSNPQYKFSFQYPESFSFTTFTAQPANTTLALITFTTINSYFRSTDPYNPNPIVATDATIAVSAYPTTSTACNATPPSPNESGYVYIYGETTAFQGLYSQFTKTTLGSVSVNSKQRTDSRMYRTFRNGLCFSLQFTVHTTDTSDSGIGSLYQVQKYLTVPFAMMEQLVSSFKFL